MCRTTTYQRSRKYSLGEVVVFLCAARPDVSQSVGWRSRGPCDSAIGTRIPISRCRLRGDALAGCRHRSPRARLMFQASRFPTGAAPDGLIPSTSLKDLNSIAFFARCPSMVHAGRVNACATAWLH